MIISHKHRFIFLKTRKTASTSIEISLSRYCDDIDILTPIAPKDEEIRSVFAGGPQNYQGYFNPFPELIDKNTESSIRSLKDFLKKRKYYNHLAAKKVRNRLGTKRWNSYFKFCFERNPWEKTISHFYWKNREFQRYSSMDDYLAAGDYCYNYPIYTLNHEIAVDFIGRYEQLEEDLDYVCRRIGLPFDGWLPNAKAGIRKDKRDFRDILNENQKRKIENIFSIERQLCGYSL